MRETLGVDGKIVIGCVARFRPEKNHMFLIDVLQEILKTEPNAVLMFAGEGPAEQDVKKHAMELGIEDKVLFLGMRTDIPDVLQAMDVFTLASLWEGLPELKHRQQVFTVWCLMV